MHRIETVLIAENTIIDAKSGRLSIINIIENIGSPTFPFLIQKLSVVAIVTREQNDEQRPLATFEIRLNGNTELNEAPIQVDFRGSLRARALVDLNGFIVKAPGVLSFHLKIGNAESEYHMAFAMTQPAVVQQA